VEVLQKQITLDDALLAGVRTYRNGCNFRLITKADGSRWLEYGCYCLINLEYGPSALLISWLGRDSVRAKRLDGVHPETIVELLKRAPCECCGAPWFEARTVQNE
jgi:hypothetical protein